MTAHVAPAGEDMPWRRRPTGKWLDPGVPHKGWECIDIEDLGEPSEICEMCEVQEIRYVHSMTHADYPDVLRCGCVCAGNMEEDYKRARAREGTLRSRVRREAMLRQRNAEQQREAERSEAERQREAIRQREAKLRRLADREGWAKLIWKVSDKGNRYINVEGYRITVFWRRGGFRLVVNAPDGAPNFGRRAYATLEAAQKSALAGVLFLETNRKETTDD